MSYVSSLIFENSNDNLEARPLFVNEVGKSLKKKSVKYSQMYTRTFLYGKSLSNVLL